MRLHTVNDERRDLYNKREPKKEKKKLSRYDRVVVD